ncbi:efflux RND transporter periplasmic adaptor subunit [Endozoicomonas montiporae]|uniref:Multidrug resistance protein MdtA-like barrel-sandwich hybrid domain-containing protein n=1 Tax=Endozoicomonas montiporae CL-33 TaxID=570277 RepID=A0A142BEQ6_9GAMM|nr:efflux RND transporter periplasmic adaptor subunit [Endozoicomonas montiporae]AMO57232.1 hypothetical protein EZMO1_3232 [Endozoicomonas montiporae CL-33]
MMFRIALAGILFSHCLAAQELQDDFTVRAMLEPVKEATVSSELSARIAVIHVRNGDAFSKGDKLLGFDCSIYQAGQDEAAADLGIARAQFENKRKLQQLDSAGELEVHIAQLEMQRMQAKLDSAKLLVERCQIVAPFDGRVVDVLVNEHESIELGTKLLWLLEDTKLDVNLVLPSRWLVWLDEGSEFTLQVDETGKKYSGHVVRLGARVDAVSQSIRVTGELTGIHKELMAGMSGTVSFNRESQSE